MPINIEDLERGLTPDSLSQRVWAFLTSNPSQAYTAEEIAEAVGVVKEKGNRALGPLEFLARSIAIGNLQGLLNRWVQRSIVVTSLVEGPTGLKESYYAAADDSQSTPWR